MNDVIHETLQPASVTPVTESDALAAHLRGDWVGAERLYRRLLADAGEPNPVTLANLGQALRRQGKDGEALEVYRAAAACADAPASLYFNLGNVLFDNAKWAEAETHYARALSLEPGLEPAAMQLARCAVKLGQWMKARALFTNVLRGNPGNFSAWLEAGHVCRQHGTTKQMLASYRQAVSVRPDSWLGHASLARALHQVNAHDEAAVSYYQALQCPDAGSGAEVHRLIGKGRLECGDAGRAVDALSQALRAAPNDAETMIDLATALMQLGAGAQAERLFERAGESTSSATLTRLAEVLFSFNLWPVAEDILRRLVAAKPDDWAAHFNLAKLLTESWRMEEGVALLDKAEALSLQPVPGARSLRAAAAGKLGDCDLCLDLYRSLGKDEGPQSPCLSSAAMASLYSDTLCAQEVTHMHSELFAPLGEGARVDFPNDRNPEKLLRVGYVTADLHHQHPVNLFMQPVLMRHDRTQLEVTVYFTGRNVDEQSRLAKSKVDRWRDVSTLNDGLLAEVIAADGIDVLVDLLGHTSHNRRALFAQRAAPVQASFLGYPSTTGIPNMDWIIADAQVAPEQAASLFTERVIRLPHCVFCYAPEADYPYPTYGVAHMSRQLTFGSFNNISKLTPRTVRLWAKVLAAVPESRLLLKAPSFMDQGAIKRFRDLFAAEGISAERLEFRGPTGLAEMMAEYADVDIALDTSPYNGGTTTLQALWMGAPVISLAGENFCQRMGASILTMIGREAWVANNENDFVSAAVTLAANRQNLLEEKKGLRDLLLSAPGMNIDTYTRDLESIYRRMWMDFCGKTIAPEQFPVLDTP